MKSLLLVALASPLLAQTYDLRLEVPFPQGQNLPQTLLTGTGQLVSGNLGKGHGAILTLERRFLEWPILRLSGGLEATELRSPGSVVQGTQTQATRLTQSGLGLGLHAQFWVPFTGLAGEIGLIERLQRYRYDAAGLTQTHDLSRAWLRVGARWRLPFPGIHPYLAASYQEPLRKDHPVRVNTAVDLVGYLQAQGTGQEFERMWTFGVGVAF